jgi:uncharacterized membrane protein YoaK (UPF0700 family)
MRSKYILPMLAEAVLLAAIWLGIDYRNSALVNLHWNVYAMIAIGAFAMGLQNATITRISGVVRTTHVTGVLTDIGLEGVQLLLWYRDRLRSLRAGRIGRVLKVTQCHPTFLRVLLLASIFGSFLFGVIAGAISFGKFPNYVLLPPIAFLLWIVFVDWKRPIADVRELDLLSDPELKAFGIVKSLLPRELGIYRLATSATGRSHRAPNFVHWVERVPSHWNVIILALSPLTRFESNSALDLETAAKTLQSRRKTLIIAGLTTVQYRVLDSTGVIKTIDGDNVCPDLEFAIARAVSILDSTRKASRSAGLSI